MTWTQHSPATKVVSQSAHDPALRTELAEFQQRIQDKIAQQATDQAIAAAPRNEPIAKDRRSSE